MDRERGIIFGCKVVGRSSPNTHGVAGVSGTDYTMEALREELPQLQGINVNVDHPDRTHPGKDRSARDRFAWLDKCELQPGGIFGDLYFLDPTDPLAVKMLNAAESKPDAFALSHNAVGKGDVRNGRYVITSIPEVRSIDIVADGGTNRSLFESHRMTIKLRELVESLPADQGTRLRKLLDLYEDAGDMDVMEPDAGAAGGVSEPDEMDHLFQAFKKCMEDDPEKANKILALLKAGKAGGKGVEEGEEEEPDETGPGKGKDAAAEESRRMKKLDAGAVPITEARALSLCKLAGIESTAEVVEALRGTTVDQAFAILQMAKKHAPPAAPAKAPRSSGQRPVQESVAPNDAKGWAAKLLG